MSKFFGLGMRATLGIFSVALVLAAGLDIASTVYAAHRIGGGWEGEANLVFRALGAHEGGDVTAVAVLLLIKVVVSAVALLWIALTLRRVPDLCPGSAEEYGFFRFGNNMFYGRDVSLWCALFGIPPLRRLAVAMSIPVAVAVILSGVLAAIANTFGLVTNFGGVVVLWVGSGVLGVVSGVELLRRGFQHWRSGSIPRVK